MRRFIRTPFAIALIVGLLCALTTATEPLNHMYWNIRFKFGGYDVPNAIIVISEQSAGGDGVNGVWSTRQQARLLEVIRRQMPQRVFLDSPLTTGVDPEGDRALAAQVKLLGADYAYVVRAAHNTRGPGQDDLPPRALLGGADPVMASWHTNFLGFALYSQSQFAVGSTNLSAFARALGRDTKPRQSFLAASEYDPGSVPVLDARRVLGNDFAPGLLTGRTIVISQARQGGQMLGYFGHGSVDPVLVDVTSAYGLKQPFATTFGELPILVMTGLLLLGLQATRRKALRRALSLAAVALPLGLPIPLQLIGIYCLPSASIAMLVVFSSLGLWHRWRNRARHTSSSGLPNMVALSEHPIDAGYDVVVAIIARYEEFLATLPTELHGECAQQIARRLTVASGSSQIYHGEGGQFAWIEEARPLETQYDHLEGLRALFSAPLRVGNHTFDTNVHFGLDRNPSLDARTRVNSALASASEALTNGRTTESFEAARLADASWDLSLHSRIDDGLRNGEIWLAFQPQWDYRAAAISGAEALIRWNHPERGPIRPDEFILQAERAGRIDTLTYWVIEQAISAHAALAANDPLFQMSINLSGQMVDKPSLVSNFSEIVRRRGIDARRLTVEVTETSGVHNRPAARHNLSQLRAMGFRLSIDDFGTGEASLSYLAELPSDELKLDRRFVSEIIGCTRNRTIVASTIGLAHALGQVVVAEGIEDTETFHMLRSLGCDHGQGYWIGRPVPLAELVLRCAEAGRPKSILF